MSNLEKSPKGQWTAFAIVIFGIFIFCLAISWPLSSFWEAVEFAAAITGLDVIFVVCLTFYWWTQGVGIDFGFIKIRGMGWPNEDISK